MNNIYLIGMPGCGKSAFGKALAKKTKREFYDTDTVIVNREGPISEIFSQKGEDYFRKLESQVLKELGEKENAVISTGGGVIKNPENITQMKRTGVVCFIDRPLEKIREDVDRDSRPLLAGGEDKLKALYDERYHIYRKSGDKRIRNDKSFGAVLYALVQTFPNADKTV